MKFRYVKGHSGNAHNDAADELAKQGASKPFVSSTYVPSVLPHVELNNGTAALDIPKVSTDLCVKDSTPLKVVKRKAFDLESHRGRCYVRMLREHNLRKLTEARPNSGQFWKAYRGTVGPKRMPDLVPELEDFEYCFDHRMNPPLVPPASFSSARRITQHLKLKRILLDAERAPTNPAFGRITVDEVAWAMNHVYQKGGSCAPGLDGILYSDILPIGNDKLCHIFNECLDRQEAPLIWFTTIIAAIPKKDKPLNEADSYRTIALESCFLKILTLLIHKRIYDWAENSGIFPPSQNGFREHYRTNNNAFVLRCMIDRARAEGKTLYAGYVDISNAFPSTDHDTLWIKLYESGVNGKFFNWLRMLYSEMSYAVTHGGNLSNAFRSRIGVLIGDPASPTLWNLFLADFKLFPDDGDLALNGVIISHLEHADDMVIISTSAQGLQNHFDTLFRYCSLNFLVINAGKSWVMIFGRLPRNPPAFFIGGVFVRYTAEFTYVGVTFVSKSSGDMFTAHYVEKAAKARSLCYTLFGMEAKIKCLPPLEGRVLYNAQVDPHLISGAEVVVDMYESSLLLLTRIQHSFLRRLLRLTKFSTLAPLFTELGIMPLRYRRLIVALGYLQDLVGRPDSFYARIALIDSYQLSLQSDLGWWYALKVALRKLYIPVTLPNLTGLTSDNVKKVIDAVRLSSNAYLRNEIESSPRLYLLHGRKEPLEDGTYSAAVMRLRHYLSIVKVESHRMAVIRLLAGEHQFASEILRRKTRYRDAIPYDQRLCRFCPAAVETPEHVLLVCMGCPEIVVLRNMFLSKMRVAHPTLRHCNLSNALHWLKLLLFGQRSTIADVSAFIAQVVAVVKRYPLRMPLSP